MDLTLLNNVHNLSSLFLECLQIDQNEIKKEITNSLEPNENENTTQQNFRDLLKAALSLHGNFLSLNAYNKS